MKVGIVTPAHDVAPYIGATIASLIAQSHTDWVMVVVDDGSTDATATVVAMVTDPRIRLLRQANAGVAAARNRGIAALHPATEAVLFLDGDDMLEPGALDRLVRALRAAPEAVAAYGAHAYVSEDGAQTLHGRARRLPDGDLLELLLRRNLFANGGHLLIRPAALRAAGGFRPDLAYGEDWEYWIRVALAGPFATVPGAAPLLLVRRRAAGAYQRMAADPDAFTPCMQAIFANPALAARCGAARLARIRRLTEAENAWIVGRERIRHRRDAEGRATLRRSVAANPAPRRLALLALAHLLPVLPSRLHGPFRRYPRA